MILLVVEPQLGKMSVRNGLKEKYKRNFHSVTNEIIYLFEIYSVQISQENNI